MICILLVINHKKLISLFKFVDTGKGFTGTQSEYVNITHVDCSTMAICEADVVLNKPIEEGAEHILSLVVKDTKGETTVVESVLKGTAPLGAFIG